MRCSTLPSALLHTSFLIASFSPISAATPPSDLDILAGQHIVYSFPSTSQPPQHLLDLTRAGLVGGVILFGENIDVNTSTAMNILCEAYAASPTPALLKKTTGKDAHFIITTDQEGGQVRRIKNGCLVAEGL